MANTLFIRLEGPMQSWGERSRWSVRDTAPEPTKSGIVGLLACALGLKDDGEIRELSRQITMGVRCDRPGRVIVDYHTVGGGYAAPQLLRADGKLKKNSGRPHVEVSERRYLCDASFLVALQAEPIVVERLARAVQRPHWPIFLGRKSCPPSHPLFEAVADHPNLEKALAGWPWYPGNERVGAEGTVRVRAVLDCLPGEGVRRHQEIISRSKRTFGPRYTRDVLLDIPVSSEEA